MGRRRHGKSAKPNRKVAAGAGSRSSVSQQVSDPGSLEIEALSADPPEESPPPALLRTLIIPKGQRLVQALFLNVVIFFVSLVPYLLQRIYVASPALTIIVGCILALVLLFTWPGVRRALSRSWLRTRSVVGHFGSSRAFRWSNNILIAGAPLVFEAIKFYRDKELVKAVLEKYPLFIPITVLSLPTAGLIMRFIVRKAAESTAPSVLQDKMATDLLDAMDNVVAAKMKHLGNSTASLTGRFICEVFDKITQPDDQMKYLAQALLTFFDKCIADKDAGEKFEVVLGEMDQKGQLVKFRQIEPPSTNIRITESELRRPDSGFSTAARTMEVVLIEDVMKESRKSPGKRRYYIPAGRTKEGSALCYPVYHQHLRRVVFVISVFSFKVGRFVDDIKTRNMWTAAMQSFAIRLSLEYTLDKIKTEARTHDDTERARLLNTPVLDEERQPGAAAKLRKSSPGRLQAAGVP